MYLHSLVMQEIHSKKGRLTNYIYLKLWYQNKGLDQRND